MKALILAAGFGSRLRPITDTMPKPLCPFFGVPSLLICYQQLVQAGIDKISINLHHKAEAISSFITDQKLDCLTKTSYEDPIRGTGGALYPLLDWLGDDDLMIVNSDIICDYSITDLIHDFNSRQSYAHLLLLDHFDPCKNRVLCQGVKVIGFSKQNPQLMNEAESFHTFAGIHLVTNQLIRSLSDQSPLDIIDVYSEALSQGQTISYSRHQGYWHDLGTAEGCWRAHQDLLRFDSLSLLTGLHVPHWRQHLNLSPLYIDHPRRAIYPEDLDQGIVSRLDQSTVMSSQDQAYLRHIHKISQCLIYPRIDALSDQQLNRCLVSRYGCLNF